MIHVHVISAYQINVIFYLLNIYIDQCNVNIAHTHKSMLMLVCMFDLHFVRIELYIYTLIIVADSKYM